MQEGDHGTFPAAQVQAIVPVGTQPLADAVRADVAGGEIESAFQVLVDGGLVLVRERNHLPEQCVVPGLFHVLADRDHQPQRVVRANVFETVNDTLAVRRRGHRGRFELGGLLLGRIEPVRIEQVQPIALAHLPLQQFENALPAFSGIGVHYAHEVLRRIAISQAGASAHFDERCEPRPDHARLRLV